MLVGVVLFDHLEEAVQYAPDFADIFGDPAFRTDGVELVKEVDAPHPTGGVDDLAKFGCGLSHEPGDQAVQSNLEQRQTEFPGQDRRGQGLPGARPAPGLVDDVAQIGGQFPVTELRFLSGDLHGDRDEPPVVALQMRPQQRLELLGTGHWMSPVGVGVFPTGWQSSTPQEARVNPLSAALPKG